MRELVYPAEGGVDFRAEAGVSVQFLATPDDMSTPPLDVLTDRNATIFLRKV